MKKEMIKIESPDRNIVAKVYLGETEQAKGLGFYEVLYKGKSMIMPSALGLKVDHQDGYSQNLEIEKSGIKSVVHEWCPLYWDRDLIEDNYTECRVKFKDKACHGRRLEIIFRIYNEGIAFQYHVPEQEHMTSLKIKGEYSSFRFPEGCLAYEEHGSEGCYSKVPISMIKDDCERPLTVVYPEGLYTSILEAGTNDYARMLLSSSKSYSDTLEVAMNGVVTGYVGYGDASPLDDPVWSNGDVEVQTPFDSPWRVIVVGDSPGELMERNTLILNLNESCQIEDTDYIKPGKCFRSGLSTGEGKASVDFAVEHNMQYIEFDAGWYGHEYDDASDASAVNLDPGRVGHIENHEGLDLQGVIRYASDNGVGVFLYVNRRALEKQLDDLLPLYKSWGVAGLKFGFVNVGSQKWTSWLLEAVRKCDEYNLMVDIHDAYRPTGYSRTYPNLLTQEGVRGNEHMPTATHNTVLPFTRCVAGPADYTVCYYSDRIKTTRAHQLAMSVVIFSPLQFLYWYDSPSAYNGEPEIEFFDRVPTVWNETSVLDGEIGAYAVVARRSGSVWYIGCITNEEQRCLNISLEFLDPSKEYTAHIFADGDDMKKVSCTRVAELDSSSTLEVVMAASGGQALIIEPVHEL